MSTQHASEVLHNAIIKLAFRNPQNQTVRELANDWLAFWANQRPLYEYGGAAALGPYWAALKWYWLRYRDAWGARANTDGVPIPAEVEPTIPSVVRSETDRYMEAYSDAGKASVDAVKSAAGSIMPWVFVAVLAYVLLRDD